MKGRTEGCMNVYIDKHTEIQKYAVTDGCTVRYMSKKIDRQRVRQTDKQTEMQTDRKAWTDRIQSGKNEGIQIPSTFLSNNLTSSYPQTTDFGQSSEQPVRKKVR